MTFLEPLSTATHCDLLCRVTLVRLPTYHLLTYLPANTSPHPSKQPLPTAYPTAHTADRDVLLLHLRFRRLLGSDQRLRGTPRRLSCASSPHTIPSRAHLPPELPQLNTGGGEQHCHNAAVTAIKRRTFFTFCFIPLVPIKWGKELRCTICQYHQST